MRAHGRTARMGTAAVLALLGLVAATALTQSGTSLARERDRDCSDFANQAEAQRFFEAHGGSSTNNFDNLDGDGDGVACESLPCPCARGGSGGGGGGSSPSVPSDRRIKARVVRDVDGDTVAVEFASGSQIDVRLIGIDTPEEFKPGYPVESLAAQARKRQCYGLR